MQQTAHRRRADLPPPLRQRRRELRTTLARPSQWRLRVAASQRVNQPLQRLLDPRLRLFDARSSSPCTAHPTGLGPTTVQLPASRSNRRARQSRRIRHQRIASIPDRTRFRGCPDPTPALIEKRLDRSVFLNNGRFEFMITSHPSIESHITQTWKCYFRRCPNLCVTVRERRNRDRTPGIRGRESLPAPCPSAAGTNPHRLFTGLHGQGFARFQGRTSASPPASASTSENGIAWSRCPPSVS